MKTVPGRSRVVRAEYADKFQQRPWETFSHMCYIALPDGGSAGQKFGEKTEQAKFSTCSIDGFVGYVLIDMGKRLETGSSITNRIFERARGAMQSQFPCHP